MRLPKPKSGYSVSPPPLVLHLTRRRLCSAQAASSSQSGSGVLGARGGKAIDNKAEVLRQVDVALGVSRPPDLEILLADHLTCTDSPKSIALHTALFRFGHAAVRYTTSDGQQRVMNILGSLDKPGSRMVNFVPPEEYLYGTAVASTGEMRTVGWDTYAQQGGAYNRDFIGVRVERCLPGATDALHAYFAALHARSLVGFPAAARQAGVAMPAKGGAARFQLVEANQYDQPSRDLEGWS